MIIDPRVQRELIQRHASTIAKGYDPALFGLGHVSLRGDGQHYVIDGQHRCRGAIESGHGHVPVRFRVHRGLSIQEEAALFKRLNANRIPVNALALFKVRVTAEEPDAVAIVAILKNFGLSVPSGLHKADGYVCAVRTVEDIYHNRIAGHKRAKKPDQRLLWNTLHVLSDAWGKQHEAYDSNILRSVAAFLLRHEKDNIDLDRLANVLSRKGTPISLIGQIRGLQGMAKVHINEAGTQVLRGLYNQRVHESRRLKG